MTREELLEKEKLGEVWQEYYPPSDSPAYTDGKNWYNFDGQKLRNPYNYYDSFEIEDCDYNYKD